MATNFESKWCPECEGWYDHLDGFCIGCDIDPKHWEGKTPEEVDVQAAMRDKDWEEEAWVVTTDSDDAPIFSADTKKEATTLLSDRLDVEKLDTGRVVAGLYMTEDDSNNEIYIGRPGVLSDHDLL